MTLAEALEALVSIHRELRALGSPLYLLDRWEAILIDAVTGADVSRDDQNFAIAFTLYWLGSDGALPWLAKVESEQGMAELEEFLRDV